MLYRDYFELSNLIRASDLLSHKMLGGANSELTRLAAINLKNFGGIDHFKSKLLDNSLLLSNIESFFTPFSAIDNFKSLNSGIDAIFSNTVLNNLESNKFLEYFQSTTYFVDPEEIDETEISNSEDKKIHIPELSKQIIGIGIDFLNTFTKDPKKLFTLKPREFEELIAEIFIRFNFEVQLTKETRDGGYDLVAINKSYPYLEDKYLIECKRYAEDQKIGVNVVRSLAGILDTQKANKGIIVTTSSFTKPAQEFATSINWKMSLHDYFQIKKWLEQISNSST
ncbi:restriction endonuclease [Leptospira sp. 2 VSF19]|uniref:Restriction endonuclease n=1 Tax=Leptospira soteropolitanensis TaxID=2950025 RepID=A0AAW5VHM9_9LEPT|nr:restriction endonuclease [Leptospira soteropolitanensis]MCW7494759.1 restriction endonuclease [Leptospira soteropolitanensis]MCW7502363.1 restriction endonuclease [Leptospira soteropolitanensis]MCW7524589.1 restriction endonuclease [Leptospira soteropolitanensis]MCW7528461.1 restriction endonuclease [Leptospira soteropolitanensis]MCW7532329.1 restriction endonuclease [Leptospira soteropolitanensis]